MLDNPNLSSDKMIEVMARGMDIVGILMIMLVALLLYIYRYEIGLFLKHWISNSKKDISPLGISTILKTNISELEKKDLSNKVDNLLHEFANPVLDDHDKELLKNIDDEILANNSEHHPPIFRTLKTIKNSNEIIYYFVNDGGKIRDFKINSIHAIKISVEPQNIIESKASGYFKFEIEETFVENEIHFELTYYDDEDKFQVKKYVYSLLENKLS